MVTVVNPVEDYENNPETDKFNIPESWENNKGIVVEVYPTEINVGNVGVSTNPQFPVTVRNASHTHSLSIEGFRAVGNIEIVSVNGIAFMDGEVYSLLPATNLTLTVQVNPNSSGIVSGGVYINTLDASGSDFIEISGSSS